MIFIFSKIYNIKFLNTLKVYLEPYLRLVYKKPWKTCLITKNSFMYFVHKKEKIVFFKKKFKIILYCFYLFFENYINK